MHQLFPDKSKKTKKACIIILNNHVLRFIFQKTSHIDYMIRMYAIYVFLPSRAFYMREINTFFVDALAHLQALQVEYTLKVISP